MRISPLALELKKAAPVELRSVGLNEEWLQDRIKDDPTLLGLGQLQYSMLRTVSTRRFLSIKAID